MAMPRGLVRPICLWLCVSAWIRGVAEGADWPQWRGPNHDGTTPEPSGWRPGARFAAKPLWAARVGEGSTSPVAIDDRLYTMGWQAGRDTVYCLEAAAGRELWRQSYPCPRYGRHAVGDQGLYGGPTATPTFDAETNSLFTLSTDGDLACWDTGRRARKRWGLNLYERYRMGQRPSVGGGKRDYGYTTAPLVWGGWLLAHVGGQAGAVVAFDKRTGRRLWASACKDHAGHAGGMAPLAVDGEPCLAVLTLTRLVVMRIDEARGGQTVGTYPWQTHYANGIVTPAVTGQRVILSSGYNMKRMVLVEVADDGLRQVWESHQHTNVCTPVIYRDRVYTAYRQVRCMDLATGKLLWQGGSFGSAGSCLLTSDGRLIVLGQGRLAIVDTARQSPDKYRELTVRKVLSPKLETWPHVVLANGRIFCKDRKGNVECHILNRDSRG